MASTCGGIFEKKRQCGARIKSWYTIGFVSLTKKSGLDLMAWLGCLYLRPQVLLAARVAQLVEHNLAKVRVASSSLVSRARQSRSKCGRDFLFTRRSVSEGGLPLGGFDEDSDRLRKSCGGRRSEGEGESEWESESE